MDDSRSTDQAMTVEAKNVAQHRDENPLELVVVIRTIFRWAYLGGD